MPRSYHTGVKPKGVSPFATFPTPAASLAERHSSLAGPPRGTVTLATTVMAARSSAAFCSALFPVQNHIEGPAAQDVRAWAAHVARRIGVGAACFFQGVRQGGQALEGPVLIDCCGQVLYEAAS